MDQKEKEVSVPSTLGRDESKHISCQYVGRENDCPKNCDKCAISMKTDGDLAMIRNDIDMAIKQYKKAVFIEPKFAEAWLNMGNAYGMMSEYNNAIASFNKALAIDPRYGKALLGKIITLKNLGELDEALALANETLQMYNNPVIQQLKTSLIQLGAKDAGNTYSLDQAIDIMTDLAYNIVKSNNLLDKDGRVSAEKKIFCKKEFAKAIYEYCKKRYASFGQDKILIESILAAFYGSLCTTLLFYKDNSGFNETTPFDSLSDHINLDELDRNAEKLLGIRQDEDQANKLWNLIYSYVISCKAIIEKVEPKEKTEDAIIDATESAYAIGMLFAMRSNERKESPA